LIRYDLIRLLRNGARSLVLESCTLISASKSYTRIRRTRSTSKAGGDALNCVCQGNSSGRQERQWHSISSCYFSADSLLLSPSITSLCVGPRLHCRPMARRRHNKARIQTTLLLLSKHTLAPLFA
jgi:hypothetical protein